MHSVQVAAERVQADAWLNRKADEAVTEAALHARYDRDIAGRPGPDEVRARVILVPTAEEARSLIAKAPEGEDFADLAKKFSKDPTASAGGTISVMCHLNRCPLRSGHGDVLAVAGPGDAVSGQFPRGLFHCACRGPPSARHTYLR